MADRALIRTDASLEIGSGHVMRCLYLAQLLAGRGMTVHFASRDLPGNLVHAVIAAGFPVHCLPAPVAGIADRAGPPHAGWLCVEPAQDAAETGAVLESLGSVDLLVVDHYGIDAGWESVVRPLARRVFVIDDIVDRSHDADMVLVQGVCGAQAEVLAARLPENCARLVGPRYILLRPEFRAQRDRIRSWAHGVKRLFVFLGGVDAGEHTSRVLDGIADLSPPAEAVQVVTGKANPQAGLIQAFCRQHRNWDFHQDVGDMAALMVESNLAVGAAGINAWERACAGLPGLVLVVADNQRGTAACLADAGAAEVLDGRRVNAAAIKSRLEALTPDRLERMATCGRELVDGRGAERVMRVLFPPPVTLRRAAVSDRDAVWQWRNEPAVRGASHNSDPISRDQHERWFGNVLSDPARALLIAEDGGRPVGVLRYDCDGSDAKVSVYLVPGCGGRGYAPAILRAGSRWLSTNQRDTRRIIAEIVPGNLASRYAFAEAGYVPRGGVHEQVLHS